MPPAVSHEIIAIFRRDLAGQRGKSLGDRWEVINLSLIGGFWARLLMSRTSECQVLARSFAGE
jgi:hypothetical protein